MNSSQEKQQKFWTPRRFTIRTLNTIESTLTRCASAGVTGLHVKPGRTFTFYLLPYYRSGVFPHYRSGLGQCTELVTQLRGEAGPRQVDGARRALQHNFGIGGAAVVTLYSKPDHTGAPSAKL